MIEKFCKKCNKTKTTTNFGKKGTGLQVYCISCFKKVNAENYEKNKLKYKAVQKKWREDNREILLIKAKTFYAHNKETISKKNKCRREANISIFNYRSAERRALKLSATPLFIDKEKVADMYRQARELTLTSGIAYQVDHIVPLVSKLVCGLHWEGNLQILLASENIKKGNRIWPDMP
jgi:hypothetical protein